MLPEGILDNLACFMIFEKLLNEYLREFMYQASEVQINSSLYRGRYGFCIHVSGFSDKFDVFFELLTSQILAFLRTNSVEEFIKTNFDSVIDSKIDHLQNALRKKPYMQIWRLLYKLTFSTGVVYEELIGRLNSIQVEEYLRYHSSVFTHAIVEAIGLGNIGRTKTSEIVELFRKKFQEQDLLKPFPFSEIQQNRQITLHPNRVCVYHEPVGNPVEKNSSICVLFEAPRDPSTRTLNNLLKDYLHTEYFASIRTEKQVGYAVFARNLQINHENRFAFEVQSGEFLPSQISEMTFEFLDAQRKKIEEYTEKEFEQLKNGAIAGLKVEYKNLNSKANYLIGKMKDGSYDFEYKSQAIKILESLSKADFVNHFENVFFGNQRILEIHLVAQDNCKKNLELIERRQNKTESFCDHSFSELPIAVFDDFRKLVSHHALLSDQTLALMLKNRTKKVD